MNSQLKISQLATWATSFFLAFILASYTFIFLIEQDRTGLPEGMDSSFALVETPAALDADSFKTYLAQQAVSQGVNIYKLTPGEDTQGRVVDYYLFPAKERAALGDSNTGSFPSFTSLYTGRLLAGSSLKADDFLGTYMVQGSPSASAEIFKSLEDLGASGYTQTYSATAFYWLYSLPTSVWLAALGVLSLALLLALAQLYSDRSSIRAGRVSFGTAPLTIWAHDIGALALPALLPSTLFLLASSCYSLLFRSGYRFSSLLGISLLWFLFLFLLLGLSLLSTNLATRRYCLLEVVQGKRPLTLLSLFSVFLLLAGSFGSLISSSYSLNMLSSYRASLQADSLRIDKGKNLVEPTFGYAAQTERGAEVMEALNSVYPSFEEQGLAYVNSPRIFQEQLNKGSSQEYLLVNLPYLKDFSPLSSETLDKISTHISQRAGLVLIVPSSLKESKDDLLAKVSTWSDFQLEVAKIPAKSEILVLDEINTGPLPLLNQNADGENFQVNPVIIVGSSKSGILNIQALASNDVVYDAQSLKKAVSNLKVSDTLISYKSVTSLAEIQKSKRTTDLYFALLGSLFSLYALLGACWTLATSFHNRHRRSLFLHKASGSTYWEKYRSPLQISLLALALPSAFFLGTAPSLPSLALILITLSLSLLVLMVRLKKLEAKLSVSTLLDS